MNYITDFERLLSIKRYSPATIKVYRTMLSFFLAHISLRKPEEILAKDIENYIHYQTSHQIFYNRTKNRW